MSRKFSSVAMLALAVGAGAVAGCPEPALARVNVTVAMLRTALGSDFQGERAITLNLCFIPATSGDGGGVPAMDAGSTGPVDDAGRPVGRCLAGETQRGIYFNQTDSFTFAVQVLHGPYRAVRVAALVSLSCGSGGPVSSSTQVAAGTSAAFEARDDRDANVTVTMGLEMITPCR